MNFKFSPFKNFWRKIALLPIADGQVCQTASANNSELIARKVFPEHSNWEYKNLECVTCQDTNFFVNHDNYKKQIPQ